MTKDCVICGKKFPRNPRMAYRVWDRQTTCSQPCAARYRSNNETPEARAQRMSKTLANRPDTWKPWTTGLTGEKHFQWKGDAADYNSKHKWIQKHWMKSGTCQHCGKSPIPRPGTRLHHATQWANISKEYHRDRSDWVELCVSCHRKLDKR